MPPWRSVWVRSRSLSRRCIWKGKSMWDIFKDWIFDIIQFFYNFCHDWGLATIIVTIIFRIIVAPLMHKQAKSNYAMQKVQARRFRP